MDEKAYEGIVSRFASAEEKIDFYNMNYALFRKLVMNILRKGLNERISFVTPLSRDQSSDLAIGMKFSIENAFNIVDKGPQSNNPEAEDFRKFWGSKSEIRRFKDGSITESVLWCSANAPTGEKRLICEKIVAFLLKHHFNIGKEKISIAGSQFDVAIRNIFNEMNETNEERSLSAIRGFDEMSKELRNLSELPLEIVGVLGIDAAFRYADLTPPLANASATKNGFVNKELKGKFLAQKVLSGILQLAPSGKWPDEVDAMKRIKAAFYIEIGKRMAVQYPSTPVCVKSDCVEILKSKQLFKLKIVHPKEIALAKETISTSNNLTKLYKTNEESLKLEFENSLLPKLTSFLHGLHHRFPSFGPTVAMAKRWLYSQFIDTYLWPDECTELIIAEMFLKNYPMEPPSSPQTGFFR
jgi:U3 small nucleolar RNA-associated protein 22